MDGRADFDFEEGRWTVLHRRLATRLAGASDWEEFGGESRMWRLMDGLANIEDNLLHLPAGPYRALAMRTFDPATGLWAIWWVDGRNPHAMDVPVKGRFDGGIPIKGVEKVIAKLDHRVQKTYLFSDFQSMSSL